MKFRKMPCPRASAFQLITLVVFSITIGFSVRAQTPNNVSIFNFGRVSENYFRGSQPNARDMADLKRFGIKTIIDLRNDRLDEAEAWAKDAGLQYFHIPLSTKKPATSNEIAYYLKLVNEPQNWPIYVHCKGGRHRTGEMTAIYRMTAENWTADRAYKEMQGYDFEDSFWYPKVLKKFVFSFYEEHKKGTLAASAGVGNIQ